MKKTILVLASYLLPFTLIAQTPFSDSTLYGQLHVNIQPFYVLGRDTAIMLSVNVQTQPGINVAKVLWQLYTKDGQADGDGLLLMNGTDFDEWQADMNYAYAFILRKLGLLIK